MTAGARFSVFALLAVFVIGWGLVATTPAPGRRAASAVPAAPAAEPEPEPESESDPEADPEADPGASAAAAQPTPAPAPAAPTAPGPEGQADPEQATEPDPDRDPVAEAYADRERVIERNVVRYDAARDRFADEPRDQAWATERERSLKTTVDEAGLGDLMEGVECRTTLCQMRMRFNGLTAAGSAVRLAPLAEAIGPDRVLRNEGPPDQRTMVIYLPRDGEWHDAPGEGPALDGK